MRILILGSFDVLHYGHIQFLNMCSKMGEVWIGLGTDEYQRSYKHEPILTWEERAEALRGLGYQVVARDEVSIMPILDEVKPDLMVAGWDWVDGPFLELSGLTLDDLAARQIGLTYLPRTHSMSTSEIIRRIRL